MANGVTFYEYKICVYIQLICKHTLTKSLGHPDPNTLLLPKPNVFPPYSATFLALVFAPAYSII